MKILILYFSGTGNTEFVAQYIKEHLDSNEDEIDLFPLERFKKENILKYDILVFGFPVYACDLPLFIQEYLKDLSATKTKTAFLFCTKGFASGAAIKNTIENFNNIGYAVMGHADINMPGSDGLAFLKKDSSAVQKMINKDFSKIEEADKLINRIKQVISSLVEHKETTQFCEHTKSNAFKSFLSWTLKKAFQAFETGLKKKFWANENCVKCLKCQKICPSKNITVSEKVNFGNNCYLCMRCVHQCPTEAIQVGKKTVGKFRWKGPKGTFNPIKYLIGKEKTL